MVVEADLRNGTLVDILPGWAPKGGIIHAVFPSRRGLVPKVHLLIDYLATHIQQESSAKVLIATPRQTLF
ncbi:MULTISPECIES: hypothetical protein [Ralstonia solanacearum species complex]|uniref:hypothetical protein n=1 Tax=Ralstonia solanacearum species complex TaxID=3116862 RepID=UPI001F097005|nr:hypothetical protein [Ralstonia solanacearum]